MLRRLPAGAGIVAILSLVAACGGSSSPTSPPSQTGAASTTAAIATSPPATAVSSCRSNQIYGALVSDNPTAEPRVLTLSIGNTLSTCTLAGPPQIHWYDENAQLMDASIQRPTTTNAACRTGATDFTTCVDEETIKLPGGGTLPAANADGPVTAVVSVVTDGLCVDPVIVSAKFIGLAFPGTDVDVQIELPQAVQFLKCAAQATLQGYGPTS